MRKWKKVRNLDLCGKVVKNVEIWKFEDLLPKIVKKNCEKLEGIVVKVMKISEREAFGGK